MGGRLTVRLRTLDPPIGVRIPASQPISKSITLIDSVAGREIQAPYSFTANSQQVWRIRATRLFAHSRVGPPLHHRAESADRSKTGGGPIPLSLSIGYCTAIVTVLAGTPPIESVTGTASPVGAACGI